MAETAIKRCGCNMNSGWQRGARGVVVQGKVNARGAEFQDFVYGYGMRVHNALTDKTQRGGWRCTVCGAVR